MVRETRLRLDPALGLMVVAVVLAVACAFALRMAVNGPARAGASNVIPVQEKIELPR